MKIIIFHILDRLHAIAIVPDAILVDQIRMGLGHQIRGCKAKCRRLLLIFPCIFKKDPDLFAVIIFKIQPLMNIIIIFCALAGGRGEIHIDGVGARH